MTAINSPFRYAGGKFYARKLIAEHIPEHSVYCEPFAGGASIFFFKDKVERNILNDIDEDIMLVYRYIRDYPEELIKWLHGKPAQKELHNYYKNEFEIKTELDRVGRWYYLNRISYSGIMNMKNCYWGYGDKYSMRPDNWPRNIRRVSKKIQGVELTCLDFEEVIYRLPDGAFVFIDPPYYNADQDKFYQCFFSREDHLRLCNVLKAHSHRLKLFITYDNCDEVRELYQWTGYIYDKEWNYCINRTDDQINHIERKGERKKGKEIFILNY